MNGSRAADERMLTDSLCRPHAMRECEIGKTFSPSSHERLDSA